MVKNNEKLKKEFRKIFCMDSTTIKKLEEWSKQRSISQSSAVRLLINEHCKIGENHAIN